MTKAELKLHREAMALIDADRPLSLDEHYFAFTHYHEGADSNQTAASAFFTPVDFANDMEIDTPSYGSIVDLCAGIGRLAYFAGGQFRYEPVQHERIVCVEQNPRFVEIGKRLLPQAEWICGDVLDPEVIRKIGQVDFAISNPPFGTTTTSPHSAPRYKGKDFDLAVMDVAATVAPSCWAIVPEDRATWDSRGTKRHSKRAERFTQATGLGIHRFSSIDPEYHREDWRGVSPKVQIVGFGEEFEEERSTTIIHEPMPIQPPAPAPAMVQLSLI